MRTKKMRGEETLNGSISFAMAGCPVGEALT
jgi:hypothetical protein